MSIIRLALGYLMLAACMALSLAVALAPWVRG